MAAFGACALILLALARSAESSAPTQRTCSPAYVDEPKGRTVATANPVLNVMGVRGSLRAESLRLLREAHESLVKAIPASSACPAGCRIAGTARVVLSAVPNKLLTSYDDFQKCANHMLQTSSRPLRFGPHRARSAGDLNSWLSEVSQGNGKDGSALYRQCDGLCSPRYSMEVVQEGGEFVASLDVVCGHARDTNDNMYTVSTRYRWACEVNR